MAGCGEGGGGCGGGGGGVGLGGEAAGFDLGAGGEGDEGIAGRRISGLDEWHESSLRGMRRQRRDWGALREGHGEEAAARTREGMGDVIRLLGCGCWFCHIESNSI